MNSQLFFILNLVFGILFLIWFLSSRKDGSRPPTRLKMKSPEELEGPRPRVPTAKASTSAVDPASLFEEREVGPASQEKNLNVLFLYNGHDWDAYQVLGVPAGASLPLVTRRYQELIRKADKGQLEFYEAAYHAILKK